jgi:hypothetical protein
MIGIAGKGQKKKLPTRGMAEGVREKVRNCMERK